VSFFVPPTSSLSTALTSSRFFAAQLEDLLLDGALARHEAVRGDDPRLTDAVRAVRRLILHRRVPPWVEVHDRVGAGEVQAAAASLERDQEHRRACPPSVEALHRAEAVLRGAVEVLVRDAVLLQRPA
jgi:hypothetical protein